MANEAKSGLRTKLHRWFRIGFLIWAATSTSWLISSFATRGVAPQLLTDSAAVVVRTSPESLAFLPRTTDAQRAGLLFIVGAGVAAEAYAPLLRPIAEAGYPVFVVRLPLRVAPLESNKLAALSRGRRIMSAHPSIPRWVAAGHSLGGALAARLAADPPPDLRDVVLIGTSHPKRFDLSTSTLRFTKVYATRDGIATPERIAATRSLLPASTRWVVIDGGNHSHFGNYGHQLLDGTASISRRDQQSIVRSVLLDSLRGEEAAP